jgi:predicted Rossmann-fold nucleotide-binding protein
MHYRIGIFGAATYDRPELAEPARGLGRALAAAGAGVITGGCSGLPYLAAHAAWEAGAEIWGFSPVRNAEEQREYVPDDDISIYAELVYVPETFPFAGNFEVCKKYRNIISTTTCDAGIIISGAWGTLNEFTNLADFGKVIGVLAGSGDVADVLPELMRGIGKEPAGGVIFESDPEMLVAKVIAELGRRERASAVEG